MRISAIILTTALFGSVAITSTAGGNGALVIKGNSCSLLDGNGNGVSSSKSHKVINRSSNGNITSICKVKGVKNRTGEAVTFSNANTGYTCSISTPDGNVSTTNWKNTVSTSGNATLRCSYSTK